MSGMTGWIDFGRDLRAQADVLAAMTGALRDRGPGPSGSWLGEHAALGCQLGPAHAAREPAAALPASREVGGERVVALLTGEIYNLPGQADGLVDEYLRRGAAGLAERLRGMFAFAIWDGRAQQLLLGRDHLGLQPLCYATLPDGALLFGSTPLPILANPLFTPRLDLEAVPILLQPRLTRAGETPLRGLRELPPAHVLTFSATGAAPRRYWSLSPAEHHAGFDETARRVRDLLEDAVSEQVAGLGSCAAMLSGGVDSTSVAALATRAFQKNAPDVVLDTFCLRFDSDPEHFVASELRPDLDAPYAAAAAAHIGSRHRTVEATVADLLEVIPATRRARGLPGWGQFDASMYLVFTRMAPGHPVGLTGEAADEFFGGYPYLFRDDLLARDDFPWLGDGPRLSDYLSADLRAVVDPREDARARYRDLVAQVPALPGEDPLDARMRTVLTLGMAGPLAMIIDRKERMSAAQGLQMRFPFCDHRLVEYVWNVPWALKATGGAKGLLKAAVADVLPQSTLTRRKSAYPHVQNPAYDAAVLAEAARIVNDPASPMAWMFDTPRINELIAQAAGPAADGRMLPGGTSPAQMFLQLVEAHHWIEACGVEVR